MLPVLPFGGEEGVGEVFQGEAPASEAVEFGADGVEDALADLADRAGLALELADDLVRGRAFEDGAPEDRLGVGGEGDGSEDARESERPDLKREFSRGVGNGLRQILGTGLGRDGVAALEAEDGVADAAPEVGAEAAARAVVPEAGERGEHGREHLLHEVVAVGGLERRVEGARLGDVAPKDGLVQPGEFPGARRLRVSGKFAKERFGSGGGPVGHAPDYTRIPRMIQTRRGRRHPLSPPPRHATLGPQAREAAPLCPHIAESPVFTLSFPVMNLSEPQIAALRQWAADGATLSDIQTRLADEFGVHMSYMDVRFLILDLGIELVEPKAPAPAADADLAKAAPPAPGDEPAPYDDGLGPEDADTADDDFADGADSSAPDAPAQDAAAPANVRVEVSRLARPGFAVTGTVTFSDGVTADWGVTARGELDLVADEAHPDYRPSPKDAQAFMTELRRAITKMGMY